MLTSIYIENIALIKKLSLEPEKGFCAFTGETGAGKSIIIDSLGLLCGARSDKEIIRTGEEEALVEGIFFVNDQGTLKILAESEIMPEEDGNITVTRKISRDGRSVAKINGRSVPLSKLRSAMALLLSIHGQQDTQAFADKGRQLSLLDSFAGNSDVYEEYLESFKKHRDIKKELDDLENQSADREFRMDMLRYKVNELKKAKIKQGEKAELTEERKLLANREKIISKAGAGYDALYNREGSALEGINEALNAVNALSEILSDCSDLAERLESAKYEIADIADSLKEYLDSDNDGSSRLDECETRLELIKKLEAKYKWDSDNFPALLEEWEIELAKDENSESEKKRLSALLQSARKDMEEKGERLSNSRKEASSLLCKRVTEELTELDMPSVTFKVGAEEKEFSIDGKDDIEFLISANKGEAPKSMAKIASGGELSRIMLCLKCVFADSESIGTIIFDEIDTGVSGRTSEKIGIRLKKAADNGKTQVICVTHSAILASKADVHYKISKKESEGRTVTNVTKLDYEGRRDELARIMGGVNISDAVLKAAEEMLG